MDLTGIRGRHRYTLRTGRRASANLLLDQLEGLRESSFPDLAVSAYLPLPDDGSWGIAADALRDLAAERRPSLDTAQRAALDRELPALRRALEGDWRRCAALVAIGHRPVRFVAGLPEPARAELAIKPEAALEQLEEQLESHPPAIVVVGDKEGARIFAKVLDRVSLVSTIQGLAIHRHRQGGGSAEQWQRRQDEHAAHNLRAVAGEITRLEGARRGTFRELLVAAPEEAEQMLLEALPAELARRSRRLHGLAPHQYSGRIRELLLEAGL